MNDRVRVPLLSLSLSLSLSLLAFAFFHQLVLELDLGASARIDLVGEGGDSRGRRPRQGDRRRAPAVVV